VHLLLVTDERNTIVADAGSVKFGTDVPRGRGQDGPSRAFDRESSLGFAHASMQVHLKAKNQAFALDVRDGESILHAGLRQGVELPFGCATGTCGTCRATCVAGRGSSAWPEAPGAFVGRHGPNDVLMCQCIPLEDMIVETGAVVYRSDASPESPMCAGSRPT
jgi:ferredoxin